MQGQVHCSYSQGIYGKGHFRSEQGHSIHSPLDPQLTHPPVLPLFHKGKQTMAMAKKNENDTQVCFLYIVFICSPTIHILNSAS